MRLFASRWLRTPPNLKIYSLRNGVAHELADGAFKEAIGSQL